MSPADTIAPMLKGWLYHEEQSAAWKNAVASDLNWLLLIAGDLSRQSGKRRRVLAITRIVQRVEESEKIERALLPDVIPQ